MGDLLTLHQTPESRTHCSRRIETSPAVLCADHGSTTLKSDSTIHLLGMMTYIDASSPSDAAIARVPTPERSVPQTIVVGPPLRKALPTVRLIPVQELKTVMPNATAGLRERYLCRGDQNETCDLNERPEHTSNLCDDRVLPDLTPEPALSELIALCSTTYSLVLSMVTQRRNIFYEIRDKTVRKAKEI